MGRSTHEEKVFDVSQTHGILRRPEHKIFARSDELGWTSIYASLQREAPYSEITRRSMTT